MSAGVVIRTVLEALAVLLFIAALLNEKKIIAFERRLVLRFRTYRASKSAAVAQQDVYCARETVRRSERQAAAPAVSASRRTRRPMRSRSRRPAA